MAPPKLYLRQNVLVEPLFNQWYAWPYLISPATAAMHVANSHLKIMRSFIAAPQTHVVAQKNPALRGGPFINYGPSRVGDIQELLDSTVRKSGRLLELAAAVEAASRVLLDEARGNSLEALYGRLPEALGGYVELVYDLNDSPSIRLIEGLLYRSPYYDESAQSMALSLVHRDERPFALSTPCLRDEGRVFVQLPFRSEVYDELFAMKYTPQPLEYIQKALGVGGDDRELFSTFFTEAEPPPPPPRYDGEGVRVRYFGHACVLIESAQTSVLVDPLVSYKYDAPVFRYTYADLPDSIDYVLITHNHQDHCMLETLLQLRHRVGSVLVPKNNGGGLADPSLKLMLQSVGFRQVRELDEMEAAAVADGEIVGLPFLGEHADLNIRSKLAYRVTLRGRTVLCAADSNNLDPRLYDHAREALGDADVIFLGMECDGGPMSWLYGPLVTRPIPRKVDQARRLNGSNYERGIGLVSRFNPQQVYVYAMGQEPWLTYLTSIEYTEQSRPIVDSGRLVEDCRRRGITSERLYGHKEITLPARHD
ncbi:MAG TPA: MBL fold metallo-hydrolase [Pyrinomonadaceae bacterium]|jgi:L-ascorbate metabolism protein UlaG (beta-lactamase superfamily)